MVLGGLHTLKLLLFSRRLVLLDLFLILLFKELTLGSLFQVSDLFKLNPVLKNTPSDLKLDFMLLLTPELPECVYTHPEAVVPTAVCDLLTGDLPGVVLPEVPVKVVGIHVCLRGGEPHAAQTALVS